MTSFMFFDLCNFFDIEDADWNREVNFIGYDS